MQFLLPLLVVFTGLAGRALTDKIIALRGGAAAVATWAQLSSLIDLVSGVSLAGIGVALVAAVAHSEEPGRHAWLRAALLPAMLLSGLAAALAVPVMQGFRLAIVPPGQESLALLAILAGWLTVPVGLFVSMLIGTHRPGAAATLLAAGFVTPWGVILSSPTGSVLVDLLLGQACFGAVLAVFILAHRAGNVDRAEMNRLLKFAPAGIAIGLASPIAMLLARSHIAETMSWEQVAVLQAAWRANDWTTAVVGGLLYAYFLPRLGDTAERQGFLMELGRAARTTLIPSALAMGVLLALLPQVTSWLYRPELSVLSADASLLFIGDWLRMVAWVFLYGLYARQVPRAVTIGEFLSIPLFALLVWFAIPPSGLAEVGLAWALAYVAYAVFNGLALREALHEAQRDACLATQRTA